MTRWLLSSVLPFYGAGGIALVLALVVRRPS
jgi:hypothetical protein